MDVLQNMMLFSELVQCGGNVYTWCYDAQGKLLRSNCPDEAFLASAFELFGCKQRMLEHGDRDDVPVTLGTALGLLWGAAFEKEEGKLKRIWVIGPVFYQDVTLRGIEDGLKYYSKLEISVAPDTMSPPIEKGRGSMAFTVPETLAWMGAPSPLNSPIF